MKIDNKKIWIYAAIASSVCLLALIIVFVSSWMKPVGEFATWPQDEAYKLRAQNAKAIKAAGKTPVTDIRAFDAKIDYFEGKANAKVKMIVYTDFDCPFCATFNKTLKEVAKAYKNDVVIIYRTFPLDAHPEAVSAANAWYCAGEQGKWEAAKDALYDITNKDDEKYLAMGKELGLDQKKYADCLKTEKYNDKILTDKEEAKGAGVGGTPTSFLNDIILPGAYQFNDFTDPSASTRKGLKSLINEQLKK